MMWYQRQQMYLGILIGGLASCQVSGGSTAGPTEAETEMASNIACTSVCQCPLGDDMCTGGPGDPGICFNEVFGPLNPNPPGPVCGDSCQCPSGQVCAGAFPGYCVPTATMTASPNPVIIPAGQTTGTFTLTWNAPGVTGVDLWGVQNLQSPGQKLFLGSGPPSGSAQEPMSVGEVATLYLYMTGTTSDALATLQVTGQH